jgi:hypothetical protein
MSANAPAARFLSSREVEPGRIIERTRAAAEYVASPPLDSNLHSLSRQLIELRIEHADLDATIDRLAEASPQDELLLRRLKKRRLALRDQIARLENVLDPREPA